MSNFENSRLERLEQRKIRGELARLNRDDQFVVKFADDESDDEEEIKMPSMRGLQGDQAVHLTGND